MISSITPMFALTATVAAATWTAYERSTAYDAGVLADNQARHHGMVLREVKAALEAGQPVSAGDRADPDLRPFVELHDWQSTVFEANSVRWLVTYPVDFPANGGRFGTEVMRRIPGWMERQDFAPDRFGLWQPTPAGGELDGSGAKPAFADPSVPDIGAEAPVLLSRLD